MTRTVVRHRPLRWLPRGRRALALLATAAALVAAGLPATASTAAPPPALASADRDAPVITVLRGPTTAVTLADEETLTGDGAAGLRLRWLLGLENPTDAGIGLGDPVARGRVELAWQLPLGGLSRRLGAASFAQLRVALGGDGPIGRSVGPDAPRDDAIAFGGAGRYGGAELRLGVDRLRQGGQRLEGRVGARLHATGLLRPFGTSASEVIGEALGEGARGVVSAEVSWLRRLHPRLALAAGVAGEWRPAREAAARDLLVGRALVGPIVSLGAVALQPFVAFEAGSGAGVLAQRRQLRLQGGVRLARD